MSKISVLLWESWLGDSESMDGPYVIFMTSSTAAIVVYRGPARRPRLLKSSISVHQNNVLTSAGREVISRCDTVLTARQPINNKSGKLIEQGVAQLPSIHLLYQS